MKNKKLPFVFLLALFIILIFILGVRYGQQVERTNKAINYLISLPPSPTAQPSEVPLGFKTFINKVCGIQFLYPQSETIKDQSSQSAQIQEKNKTLVSFNCEKTNEIIPLWNEGSVSTSEVKLNNLSYQTRINNKSQIIFQIKNPRNGKITYAQVDQSFLPLFQKSFEFTQ